MGDYCRWTQTPDEVRGFARIGNTVHHEDFATKLLVTLAHPQNKGASRTVRDALVRSFIAGGNPAALLLPCDKTIYSIAVKIYEMEALRSL